MELPQRPGPVQSGAGEVADKQLEFVLIRRTGQRYSVDMGLYIEVWIILPIGDTESQHRSLPKASEF